MDNLNLPPFTPPNLNFFENWEETSTSREIVHKQREHIQNPYSIPNNFLTIL